MNANLRNGLAAAAVAMMTAVPASAAHAVPLQPPVQIDNGGSGWTSAVAVNAGQGIVSLEAQGDGLKVITSAGAGQWNPAVTLTSPTARADGAAVTVDQDGNQTVVWGEYFMIPSGGWGMPNPGPTSIYAASRASAGAWSAPEKLTPDGVAADGYVAAVVAPDGHVTATWSEGGGDQYFSTRAPGGAWSPRAQIAGAVTSAPLELAVIKDGTVMAVWRDSTTNAAVLSTLPVGGAWTTPVDISGTPVGTVTLDTTLSGDTTVVWNNGTGVHVTRRPAPDAAWSTPELLSGSNGAYGYYPAGVAVDVRGRAVVAWNEYGSGGNKMYGTARAEDGTWSAPVIIGPGDGSRPSIGMTPDGESYVSWAGMPTRLVTRAADGTWSGVTMLTAFSNSDPVMATDPDGDVLLAGAPNASPVQVAGFDQAGPGLRKLTVPATVESGASFDVSVSPLDLWAGLGTVTWDFGDGTTATGTATTHRFLSAGTKTVKVTATDAFGRARSRTRTVLATMGNVADPDPTPEPPVAPTPTPPATATPACTPRSLVKVKWTLPKGAKARRATITVANQKARKLKRNDRSAIVDLRKATGTVTVTIRTRTTKGKLVTKTERYTVCS